MTDPWFLVDRSCAKRSNDECAGLLAKRRKRIESLLEEATEWEHVPQIRGGSSRPRPPPLGPPPNRATNSGSQDNTANTARGASVSPSLRSSTYIIEDDDGYEEKWRDESVQQNTSIPVPPADTNKAVVQGPPDPPRPPPQVGNTSTPNPPGQGTEQLPTPPQSNPSNTKQDGDTGAATVPGGPTATTTAGMVQRFPTENEILHLFDNLQNIVTLWVEECLPDVFPPEFRTDKPERYWELCGWTRPISLGDTVLQNRSWAKYVYESWVWRLLYQEIFHVDSLAWAGFDAPITSGGLGGVGRTTNEQFGFIKEGRQTVSHEEYRRRIRTRAATMRRVREESAVTENRKIKTTGWLVEEMLVAFYPYFPDEYQPIDHPENIEVLIRDTKFLIVKAQELDHKLRSANHAYEMILGKEGDVVRISGVPSPTMQSYSDRPNDGRDLRDDDDIALIVVPGLAKNVIQETAGASPQLAKVVRRRAKAFSQMDLLDAITAP